MIIVKIHYGLGNQLFQYALAKSLQLKLGYETKLDNSFYSLPQENLKHPRIYALDKFNISLPLAKSFEINNYYSKSIGRRLLNKLERTFLDKLNRSLITDSSLVFNEKILKISDGKYLSGYWQDERYFKENEVEIRNDLVFKFPAEGINNKMLKHIKCKENSVCIHIRRGDYISDLNSVNAIGFCNEEYYKKATEIIASRVSKPYFFVFSDEPNWAKENFRIPYEYEVIDINNEENAIEDLRLMCSCSHLIISNSSFGWWASWLNKHNNKVVIAPKKWRKDGIEMFTPSTWERI